MPKLSGTDRIESFLKEQGWPVTRIGDVVLRSSFRGESGMFPLVAQFEEGFLKLMVLPIVRMPADATKAEKLYEKLLRLNGEIMLARFSLDEDGDVLLSVEFPEDELDPSEVRDALDVLTYYAERYQAEIRAVVA
jgi:hypothetical protein